MASLFSNKKADGHVLQMHEAYGSLLADTGDGERAIPVLRRAIQLAPSSGHIKYMYLGQLLDEPEESLLMTKKGVELLQSKIDRVARDGQASKERMEEEDDENDGEEDTVNELNQQRSGALCSLAEMILGQAEAIDSVSSEVETLLSRAAIASPSSPEPGQVLASLRYEQGRPEEALAELQKSMKLWFLEDHGVDEDGMADGEEEEEGERDGEEREVPSYEFRFECAKLLLELDDSTEAAIQVLESLVEEDDRNAHTWHLLGMAYYAGGMLEEAKEIHEKGMALLKSLKVPEDDDLYADFADLASAIEHALQS